MIKTLSESITKFICTFAGKSDLVPEEYEYLFINFK